jgi:hypothetical protein
MEGMPDALQAGARRGLAKNRENGHVLPNK